MTALRSLFLLSLLLRRGKVLPLSGTFWHITDLHLDPSFDLQQGPGSVCESSGQRPATRPGPFGAYECDAPWSLVNSSVFAMRSIMPKPDFILWTGDDTPHVPNKDRDQDWVLSIISNLSSTIRHVFPDTKVYSALGNHDYHPKNQLPAETNAIYEQTARLWQDWLEPESQETFRKGAYYTERLLNRTGFRIMVLNTNLYYDQNMETQDAEDPAGQFSWMERVLTEAADNGEKVYVIGHVPPGLFEKKRGKGWFRPGFNARYLALIQKHHAVLRGHFYGHHHTDSFRMLYAPGSTTQSDTKSPLGAIFLTPGVTPWKTTLPGVKDGANNPAIRLFEYDTETLQVKDLVTYYLNLSRANQDQAGWEKLYRLTESFQVADASPASMQRVLERVATEPCVLQTYYRFNSVSYDLTECDAACRVDHVCAVRELDYQMYERCVTEGAAEATVAVTTVVPLAISLMVFSCC